MNQQSLLFRFDLNFIIFRKSWYLRHISRNKKSKVWRSQFFKSTASPFAREVLHFRGLSILKTNVKNETFEFVIQSYSKTTPRRLWYFQGKLGSTSSKLNVSGRDWRCTVNYTRNVVAHLLSIITFFRLQKSTLSNLPLITLSVVI